MYLEMDHFAELSLLPYRSKTPSSPIRMPATASCLSAWLFCLVCFQDSQSDPVKHGQVTLFSSKRSWFLISFTVRAKSLKWPTSLSWFVPHSSSLLYLWTHLLFLFPSLTLPQTIQPLWCPHNMPGMLLPQDLCTEIFSAQIYTWFLSWPSSSLCTNVPLWWGLSWPPYLEYLPAPFLVFYFPFPC